jgi:indole-3-acetate monooxygenase
VGVLDEAARKLAEVAGAAAARTEQGRALAPEVAAALRDSGLARAGLPVRLGGPGATPGEVLAAAETVAAADASAGWCVSINATSALLGAYLPEDGAREVFGDPASVACGVWAPRGRARQVDGGLVVSGQWPFCSGIGHSDWMFGGALVTRGDADPLPRVLAVPVRELEVLDTWHTGGLRGTGSHDAKATEVFVPHHRVLSVFDGPSDGADPLARFPLFGFFALSIAAAALGNARGAVTDLTELAAVKKPSGASRTLAQRSATQAGVAEAEAALRAARLLFHAEVDRAWQAARGHDPVPVEARLGLRLAATHATRTAARVAERMYDLGGGAAIYSDSPLQRRFRDAHTATAHFQVNPATWELTGRLLLGLPASVDQL